MVYGDDKHPEHVGHIVDHYKLHPENNQPFPLASPEQHKENRKEALAHVQSGLVDSTTGLGLVRDEKPLAMQAHTGTTTVKRVSANESSKEGSFAAPTKKLAEKHNALIHVIAGPTVWDKNPDKDLRHAYSSPDVLNSQKLAESADAPVKPDGKKGKKPATHDEQMHELQKQQAAVAHKPKLTPEVKEAEKGTKILPDHGLANSESGNRNAWHPNTDTSTTASHANAPPPHKQLPPPPPRPQNQAAYDKMLEKEKEPHKEPEAGPKRPLSLDSAGATEMRKTWTPPPQGQAHQAPNPVPVPHTDPLPHHDAHNHTGSPPASPVTPSKPLPPKAKNQSKGVKQKSRKR